MPTKNFEAQARERVSATPELDKFSDIIFYDWNDPDHYEWIATASIEKIVEWAQGIRDDEEVDAQA